MVRTMRVAAVTGLLLCLAASRVAAQAGPAIAGQWVSVAPLPYHSTALHLLPTGKVMFYGNGPRGVDTRLWDPATATTSTMPLPGYDVFCSGHAFLADGRLFIAGGHIVDNVGLPNSSTYDAVNNVWARGPDMNAGRWYPTATTLANGDVLVVSGSIDRTVGTNPLPQVFEPASGASGAWRNLTSAQRILSLYPQMFLAPNGKVFNAAPQGTTRYLDTSGTGAWTVVATRAFGDNLYGSSVMYDDGKVLAMGGGDPPTNTAEVINLNAATPSWRSVGSMAFARRQLNATLLPDGKVLVTGGTRGAGFNNADPALLVKAAEMWDPDPLKESWTTMASAQAQRIYHSAALLLPDGRVLTTGGDGITQVEVYSPPYLFNADGTQAARPTITSAPAAVNLGQSFFVGTPDAASIKKVTWIRLGSVTHAFNHNQRINRLSVTEAAGGGGLDVVPPSDPNLAPPGHYMLFILNGSGVPSIAKIIRLDLSPQPVDTTSPVIADVTASSISSSGASITWSTDEPSDSQVEYGTTIDYGSSTTLNPTLVKSHSVELSGLAADTLYHYRVKSKDAAGNPATSADFTLTTLSPPSFVRKLDFNAAAAQTAAGFTGFPLSAYKAAAGYGWQSIAGMLTRNRGVTDPLFTDFHFHGKGANAVFLLDVPNGSYDVTIHSGDPAYNHTGLNVSAEGILKLSNLSPQAAGPRLSSTFTVSVADGQLTLLFHDSTPADHWVVNGIEVRSSSSPQPADTTSPVIADVTASSVSSSGATITWSTDEPSDSQVEYGTTIDYGSSTTLNPTLVKPHSVGLSGLAANTLYHYRVKSKDAAGNLATSADFTLTTPSSTPSFLRKLDFNAAAAQTAAGFTGFPLSAYNAAAGYGWQSIAGMQTRNRGVTDPLFTDFHYHANGADAVFLLDLPNGSYDVTIHSGDPAFNHTGLNVSAEGILKLSNLSPNAAGPRLSSTFTVSVADGQLTLLFHDSTPADQWVVNGIEVKNSP